MKHKLWKVSKPGWYLESDCIYNVRLVTEGWVCSSCFMTKEETLENLKEELDKGNITLTEYEVEVKEYTPHCPENYESMSDYDKVDWMLSTACGCEFMFEEED